MVLTNDHYCALLSHPVHVNMSSLELYIIQLHLSLFEFRCPLYLREIVHNLERMKYEVELIHSGEWPGWISGTFLAGRMFHSRTCGIGFWDTFICATCISCKSIFEHANNTRCSPFHELLLQGLRVKSGRSIKNLSLIEKVQIFKISKGLFQLPWPQCMAPNDRSIANHVDESEISNCENEAAYACNADLFTQGSPEAMHINAGR